ncbi:MAG: radical SAM protein [Candidatus Magasanikbacteria bacterium]
MYYQKSKFLHYYNLQNDKYAFIHSINQEIFFGNKKLKLFFESYNQPREEKDIKMSLNDDIFFNYFVKNAFFVPDISQENIYNYTQILKNNNKKKAYTLLRIMLTDLCNLNCKYCKVEKNIKKMTSDPVTSKDLDDVIKKFFKKSEVDTPKVVHITGGEPCLFWKKIEEIVLLVHKNKRRGEKFFIVIGTNSILLDRTKMQFIKENNIKVIVSIDGMKEHHDTLRVVNKQIGTFAFVDKKIRELKEAGCEVGLSMVIGKHNYRHIDKIIDFLIKEYDPVSLGVNFMKQPSVSNLEKFSYTITPEEYVTHIYDVYKKYRHKGLFFELPYRKINPFVKRIFRLFDCGAAAGTTINIDPKGNVGPCKSFLIMEKVFSNKIGGEEMDNILRSFKERISINNTICQKCPAIAICGNGCAYSAYIDNGDLMSIDNSACQYSKLFHKAIVEDLYSILHDKLEDVEYYIPTMQDREKLFGTIKVDRLTLASSIGHETV